MAIFYHCANRPDNAALEERQRAFRLKGRCSDCYFFDLATEQLTNITAAERVSTYNTGLSFWPGDPKKLKFHALVDGRWRPFSMDLDGGNKKDLSKGLATIVYGVNVSPMAIAWHTPLTINCSWQMRTGPTSGTSKRDTASISCLCGPPMVSGYCSLQANTTTAIPTC
ncbi:MAG: hypothetical protein HY040_09590 [Planctomycetes bacterium]|nr:hypothetical protein [Planctomycetota bacterium]